jgi:hypothetical protein
VGCDQAVHMCTHTQHTCSPACPAAELNSWKPFLLSQHGCILGSRENGLGWLGGGGGPSQPHTQAGMEGPQNQEV